MLSDGALILAPPGKMPYEFALHAGETAVFPAVSPTVENDTDSAVRALLVEVKQPMRSTVVAGKSKAKWRYVKGKSRGRVAAARDQYRNRALEPASLKRARLGQFPRPRPMRRSISKRPTPSRPEKSPAEQGQQQLN
jgi:hypothetical protein